VKRSEHICATPDCGNTCPREYPFCASCWRRVPKELRAEVRAGLSKRGTSDLDASELYFAVAGAAASVREVEAVGNFWERAQEARRSTGTVPKTAKLELQTSSSIFRTYRQSIGFEQSRNHVGL
jgi:hypothetical protein